MANPSGRKGGEKMELKLIHSGTFYKGVTKGRMGPHYPDKPYNVGTVHHAVVDANLSTRGNERTILPTGYEVTSSGLVVRK